MESFLLSNEGAGDRDSDDDILFLLGALNEDSEMPEIFLLTNCGCVVIVDYEYDVLTAYLIEQYDLAGLPKPERIYKAWDYVIRDLKSRTMSAYFTRFEIIGDEDNPTLEYLLPDLIGTFILGVSIEGQGIDESDPVKININTTTGLVSFAAGSVTKDQKVKIDYKK